MRVRRVINTLRGHAKIATLHIGAHAVEQFDRRVSQFVEVLAGQQRFEA